jgi:hypothetical protein
MCKKKQREEEEIAKSVEAQIVKTDGMDIDGHGTENVGGDGTDEQKMDVGGEGLVNGTAKEDCQMPDAPSTAKQPPSSVDPTINGQGLSLQAKMEIVEKAIPSVRDGEQNSPSSSTPFLQPPSRSDGERNGDGVATTTSDSNSNGTSREEGEISSTRMSPKILPTILYLVHTHLPHNLVLLGHR